MADIIELAFQAERLSNNNEQPDTTSSIDYDDEILLNYGEKSKTKYNIVLCEHYNGRIHGPVDRLEDQFLVISCFKKYDYDYISEMAEFYNDNYFNRFKQVTPHAFIRNYKSIITNENYIQPEIAECHYLTSGECICIKKTFWLRILQRKLKNLYKKKRD
uniref:Uncharacterized protein n=1 Tax=viral metagenome TaxID=1070528 RepID=A0A6C0E4P7_9ZZZZ